MNLIFLCISGSQLYGTNRPDSDLDLRGVCLNPPESLLGFTKFEQYLPNKEEAVQFSSQYNLVSEDVQIYGLNKFLQLALDANPNIIELLFADNLVKNNIKYNYNVWNKILDERESILSTKVIHTFSGYAYSQLARIKGHKRWLDSPPIKPEPFDYGMELTAKGGQKWTDSNKYNQYQSLIKDYTSYETWLKERNPARKTLEEKYGYDTKHAMHLVRLLLEAEELLILGRVQFPFTGGKLVYLLDVLNGKYDYDYIVDLGENSHDRLVAMEKVSVLPQKPSIKKIEQLLIDINKENVCGY